MLSNPTISLDENLEYVFHRETSDVQTQLKKFAVSTTLQGNAILISGCKENQTSVHGQRTEPWCPVRRQRRPPEVVRRGSAVA